jgi:hypothetical protein
MLMKSSINYHQIFLKKVLGYCQICEREVKDLARFGNSADLLVEVFRNPSILWLPVDGAYCRNMAILNFLFSKSYKTLHFVQKILCTCCWAFFFLQNGENSPPKKKPLPIDV